MLRQQLRDGVEPNELCRLCAEENDNMVSIFSEEGQGQNLAEKINNSLPILVTPEDMLPLRSCVRCVQWLEMVHEMREHCREADRLLRGLMGMVDPSAHLWRSKDNLPAAQSGISRDSKPFQTKSSNMQIESTTVEHPPLRCHECMENLEDADSFCYHQKSQHSRAAVWCSACCVFFSSTKQLREHQLELHPKPVTAVRPIAATHFIITPGDSILAETKVRTDRPNPVTTNMQLRRKKKEPKRKIRTKYVKKYDMCHYCKKKFDLSERVAYKKHLAEHQAIIKAEKLKHANIKCDYCEMKFLMEKSKRHHMLLNHREYKPYICDSCGKGFHAKNTLRDHIYAAHTDEHTFLCAQCGKAFKSQTRLRFHAKSHNLNTSQCSVCNKLLQPHRIKFHMRRHFSDPNFRCSICGRCFYSASSLRQHMATHRNEIHECEICGKGFNRKNNLTEHRKRHIDKETRNYVCPANKCKQQFQTKDEVITHCNEHSKDEFVFRKSSKKDLPRSTFYCWFCEKYFRDMNPYISHMNQHQEEGSTSELKLSCSICYSHFKKVDPFVEHVATHPEAYSFSCYSCSKTFVTYDEKIIHEREEHNFLGDLECNICNKVFATKHKLKTHKVIHSGVRQFQCPHCPKSFYFKKYLDGHSSIHTGERKFACEFCSLSFRMKADLQQHVSIHTGVKAHQCQQCQFSSHRRKDLMKHYSSNHPEHAF